MPLLLLLDTPTKAQGESLEKMIETEDNPNEQADLIAKISNISKEPPTPLTPIDQSSPSNPKGLFTNLVSDISSRFWNNLLDDDESDEDMSEEEIDKLREKFKRKAEGSPDALAEFEKVLSKKEKKRIKKSMNKSN